MPRPADLSPSLVTQASRMYELSRMRGDHTGTEDLSEVFLSGCWLTSNLVDAGVERDNAEAVLGVLLLTYDGGDPWPVAQDLLFTCLTPDHSDTEY